MTLPSRLAWVAFAAAHGGCGNGTAFSCVESEQCVQAGVAGTCEENGYCSFPDDTCDSGRRFGDRAPVGVAEVCVSASEGSSSGPTLDDGVGTGSSSAGDELPVDPASSEAGDGTPSTTTLDGGSSGGTTAETGTATGEPLPTCEVDFQDPFDAEDMPWIPWTFGGAQVYAMDGHAVVEIPSSAADQWNGAGLSLEAIPMAGGWARTQVSTLNDPSSPVAQGISLENSLCEYHVRIDEMGVSAVVWHEPTDADLYVATVPLPELPVWLQVRMDEDGATIYFELSTDESTWQVLAQDVFPECDDGSGQHASLLGAGGSGLSQTVLRHFDAFSRCSP